MTSKWPRFDRKWRTRNGRVSCTAKSKCKCGHKETATAISDDDLDAVKSALQLLSAKMGIHITNCKDVL